MTIDENKIKNATRCVKDYLLTFVQVMHVVSAVESSVTEHMMEF